MLQNTKSKGFTLVELLIVIVVIAILAAISIVAYNGIQNRGKNTAAQSLASQVAKKAQAYNTIQSSYPADAAAFNASGAPAEADLEGLDATGGTSPANENQVGYVQCGGGTGATIYYQTFPMSGSASVEEMPVGTC